MKTELNTMPNFLFEQRNEDGIAENPILVKYWNGIIEFKQGDEEVLIDWDTFNDLVKEVKRHMPEALRVLSKKS